MKNIKKSAGLKLYDFQRDWISQRIKQINQARKQSKLPRISRNAYIEMLLEKDGMPTKI